MSNKQKINKSKLFKLVSVTALIACVVVFEQPDVTLGQLGWAASAAALLAVVWSWVK